MSLSRRAFVAATGPFLFLTACLGRTSGSESGSDDGSGPPPISSHPRVIHYAPSAAVKGTLTPEGTVMVLFARKGASILTEAVARVAAGTETEFIHRLYNEFQSRTKVDVESALAQIESHPNKATLEYGDGVDRALLSDVVLPDEHEFGLLYLTYSGAAYDAEQFRLIQTVRDESRGALDCVIFVRAPDSLTTAEAAALALVRPGQRSLIVGTARPTPQCEIVALFVLGVVAGVAFAHAINQAFGVKAEAEEMLHLSDGEVNRLGPARTAARLIELREQLLSGK
jgi:hypothetical protein